MKIPRYWIEDENSSTDSFTEILGSAEAWCAVGRKYLDIFPHESNLALLQNILFGNSGHRGTGNLQLLAWQRQKDFEHGNIVLLDGWVLAQSEARACALMALS